MKGIKSFIRKGVFVVPYKAQLTKKQCPKVKSGQAGFCFGKRTPLKFIPTGVIVMGVLWLVFFLLFAALSWCLKVVICDYCQHCGSEERPHFVTYTFN